MLKLNDLTAQLQDKTIVNAEMRERLNKMKGKGVDTNFGKPSILGKPPLKTIINQLVVRQLTVLKSEQSLFSKTLFASQVVEKYALKNQSLHILGPSRNSSKNVSIPTPKESVGSNDMVHNYYLEEAKKKAQLQKYKALNLKPSVITPAKSPNTVNGNKSKPKKTNQLTRN
ncbi:hypothetical protein Tco_0062932 [Tanacetum coccineum]